LGHAITEEASKQLRERSVRLVVEAMAERPE
jgi:hypothetical protein